MQFSFWKYLNLYLPFWSAFLYSDYNLQAIRLFWTPWNKHKLLFAYLSNELPFKFIFNVSLWFCCFAEYWVICPIKITKFSRRVHFSSLSVLDEIKLLMICTWRSGVTQTPWKSLLFNQNALVHHCNWSGIGDHIFWAIRR